MWQVTGDRWQVTGERWQVIGDRWQVTGDRWQVTGDRWRVTGDKWAVFVSLFWICFRYRCYYLHTLIDWMSPVCGIFVTQIILKTLFWFSRKYGWHLVIWCPEFLLPCVLPGHCPQNRPQNRTRVCVTAWLTLGWILERWLAIFEVASVGQLKLVWAVKSS